MRSFWISFDLTCPNEDFHSIYHFNALLKNTTTIEGWEKDKVATLVRRGKIQDVSSCLITFSVQLKNRLL